MKKILPIIIPLVLCLFGCDDKNEESLQYDKYYYYNQMYDEDDFYALPTSEYYEITKDKIIYYSRFSNPQHYCYFVSGNSIFMTRFSDEEWPNVNIYGISTNYYVNKFSFGPGYISGPYYTIDFAESLGLRIHLN